MKDLHIDVLSVVASYPPDHRERFLRLRQLIFEVAIELAPQIGKVEESLKWGEPSYRPNKPKSGTAIRLAWHVSKPNVFGMYFHCKTTLVDQIKNLYPQIFIYEGNRGVLLKNDRSYSDDIIKHCIDLAFRYYCNDTRGSSFIDR